jgi:hypothetical protein
MLRANSRARIARRRAPLSGGCPDISIHLLVFPQQNYVWLKYHVVIDLTCPETFPSLGSERVAPLPLSALMSGEGGLQ